MIDHEAQSRWRAPTSTAGRSTAGFRRRSRRCGAAAVEMALVLPLVLLLTFAAVDFGRVVNAYLVVSNAARCGAEYGSMHEFTAYTQSTWQAQVQSAMTAEMQGLQGYSAANLQSTITSTTDGNGLFVLSVTASYPFTTIVNWPGIPAQVQLSHQVTMRQIR
jgi:Flp pilus assembly protein TadG